VTQIPGKSDGFRQILIQAKGATDRSGKGGNFDRVGQAGTNMIAGDIQWDLGFVFERAKRGAVNDPLTIPLKLWPKVVGLLWIFASQAVAAFCSVRS